MEDPPPPYPGKPASPPPPPYYSVVLDNISEESYQESTTYAGGAVEADTTSTCRLDSGSIYEDAQSKRIAGGICVTMLSFLILVSLLGYMAGKVTDDTFDLLIIFFYVMWVVEGVRKILPVRVTCHFPFLKAIAIYYLFVVCGYFVLLIKKNYKLTLWISGEGSILARHEENIMFIIVTFSLLLLGAITWRVDQSTFTELLAS